MHSYSHVIKSNQYEAQANDSNDDTEIEEELTMRGNFVGFVKQKLNLKSKEDNVLEIHKLHAIEKRRSKINHSEV